MIPRSTLLRLTEAPNRDLGRPEGSRGPRRGHVDPVDAGRPGTRRRFPERLRLAPGDPDHVGAAIATAGRGAPA